MHYIILYLYFNSEDNINAGEATVIFTGKGNYTDSVTETFEIAHRMIQNTIADDLAVMETGKVLVPKPVVKYGSTTLKLNKDYKVYEKENKELKTQLENRKIAISKVGSIAEASLALTKVFDEAQKAVDRYLDNVQGIVREKQTAKYVFPAKQVPVQQVPVQAKPVQQQPAVKQAVPQQAQPKAPVAQKPVVQQKPAVQQPVQQKQLFHVRVSIHSHHSRKLCSLATKKQPVTTRTTQTSTAKSCVEMHLCFHRQSAQQQAEWCSTVRVQ